MCRCTWKYANRKEHRKEHHTVTPHQTHKHRKPYHRHDFNEVHQRQNGKPLRPPQPNNTSSHNHKQTKPPTFHRQPHAPPTTFAKRNEKKPHHPDASPHISTPPRPPPPSPTLHNEIATPLPRHQTTHQHGLDKINNRHHLRPSGARPSTNTSVPRLT